MADEAPAATAAPAPSSPLSSPAPSPSIPASQAASQPAPQPAAPTPSPAGTAPTTAAAPPSATPAAAERPAWLPETFKSPDELVSKFNEYATRVAADDVRKGTLPQTADAYKVELPADFKPPAGVEFKIDAADPALGQLKAVAHKHGLTQDAVNELLGVYAGREVGTEARIAAARTAEVAKLGASGPARVDAVTRFMDASGLGVLKSTLVTAAQVEAMEAHITRITNQGGASFSQSHRAPADDKAIPNYANMSFEQRRQAQDQQRAQRKA